MLLLFSCPVVSDSLCGLQHSRLLCPSVPPRVCSDWCPFSWWCHPTISTSVVPFSSRLQSFPASGPLQMSQLFPLGGHSIGASASASVLPMNIQDWFPWGLTDSISLKSKGFSTVFSNTTAKKQSILQHLALSTLWSNSHIGTWLLEKPGFSFYREFQLFREERCCCCC